MLFRNKLVSSILVTCFLLLFNLSSAQSNLQLIYSFESENGQKASKNFQLPSSVTDSFELNQLISKIKNEYIKLSYLLVRVDILKQSNDTFKIVINPGKSVKWLKLKNNGYDLNLLNEAGFSSNYFSNQIFNPLTFQEKVKNALDWLQNNSFPFASFKLDSVTLEDSLVSANLNFEKGVQIYFDSIKVIGDLNVSKRFLSNYTNIKVGKNYNENILKQTDERLNQLPFLNLSKPSVVYFYGNKAKLIVFANNNKVSSFDGIIGFAPNNTNNNKLIITGEVNLKLQNILGSGKTFELNYRSFLGNSQELKLKFNYPYIFNTKIGIDYGLNLLLYDTLFFDLQNNLTFQYRFVGTNSINFFYQTQSTSLLSIDTVFIKQNKSLPNISDLKKSFYGVGINLNAVNYAPNPTKGYLLDFDFALGVKEIIKNPTINNIQVENSEGKIYQIYDSINLVQAQYRVGLKFTKYVKLVKNFVFKTDVNGALLQTDNLFLNELYRLGGIKTLRGFDEQSIFANKYLIFNAELRYLLDKNSNVFAFYNRMFYKNEVARINTTDSPYGFGAGINFDTGKGILSLVYAVGKQFENPIEYNNAKIHFSFINYF